MPIKTIFLDRDGVINKEVKYLHKIDNFVFIEGVFEACQHFLKQGFEIIIITNQSGIGRKFFHVNDYLILTNWMLSQFNENQIKILDVFYCPHLPNYNCTCRKPKPGMLIQAMYEYNIDMENSWMIGDKEDDIKAANAAGIENTILVRSGHPIKENESEAKFFIDSIYNSIEIIGN